MQPETGWRAAGVGAGREVNGKVMLKFLDNGKPVEDVKLAGDMIRCAGCASGELAWCERIELFQSSQASIA